MKSPTRVYADTSVFGGAEDEIFAAASRAFFEQVREGRFSLVVSVVVEQELSAAPERIRAIFQEFLPVTEVLHDLSAGVKLQRAYLDAGVVSKNWAEDAMHVALATTSSCDVIVSWNFRHIVNLRRISMYNAVSMLNGYRSIEIRSPLEILDYDERTS
jgi:predicted nucleic acid-binding protein